jgi:hypothetical protein
MDFGRYKGQIVEVICREKCGRGFRTTVADRICGKTYQVPNAQLTPMTSAEVRDEARRLIDLARIKLSH